MGDRKPVNAEEAARWSRAAELLEQVIQLPPEQQASAVLELGNQHHCSEELTALFHSSQSTSVLDGTLDQVLDHVSPPVQEVNALQGQELGQWKLDEELGRGGMSVVYHAHRTSEDFHQEAALKILTVATLGDKFIEGFLRERQILSDLQHPGIAQLIDGGLMPDGAPYLVMQRVHGERIDQWCAAHKPSQRQVVEIMIRLCHAVAYAQRHLVVHQDINPTNVLMDEHGRPVLIDFGIARIMDEASDQDEVRAFTPSFAAPEQAAGGVITTATDVYAIGALLQHLLKGRDLPRDLRCIIDTAMNAEPEARYGNARRLGSDLTAWCESRPVEARNGSAGYRLERFMARNRWGVASAILIVLSLFTGAGVALWQAKVAASERDQALREERRAVQVTQFMQDLFRASDPDSARGAPITARSLLDQGAHQARSAFESQPELRADMLVLLGNLYEELGELEDAEPLLLEGLAAAEQLDDPDLLVSAHHALALLRMEQGEHLEAIELLERAEALLAQAQAIPGERHSSLMHPILFSLAETGQAGDAVERGNRALALAQVQPGLSDTARYNYLYSLATVELIAELPQQAEQHLLQARALNNGMPRAATEEITLLSNLAGVYHRKGSLEKGLSYSHQARTLAEEVFAPNHTGRARMLSNEASSLNALGRHSEAIALLDQALGIYETIYGEDGSPRVAAASNNMGQALVAAGRPAEAVEYLARAQSLAGEYFGTEDTRFGFATGNLGNAHRLAGNLSEAEQYLEQSLAIREAALGPEHRVVGVAQAQLAALRLDQGQYESALNLAQSALALFDRVDYQNPQFRLAAETRRAEALAGLGRRELADTAFEATYAMGKAAGSDAGRSWPIFLAAYARFLHGAGDPGAEAVTEEALAVHLQRFGESHPSTRALSELEGEQP